MEKTIVLSNLVREVDSQLRAAIRSLQENYSHLREIKEWECPKCIEGITYEKFKEAVTPSIEAIRNDISLTEGERVERISKWNQLLRTFARFSRPIEAVVEEWPEVEWQYYEPIGNFVPVSDLDSIVVARCTRPMPQDAVAHYELIQTALKHIKELRTWESAHNVKQTPLALLANYPLDVLAEAYLNKSAYVCGKTDMSVTAHSLQRLLI